MRTKTVFAFSLLAAAAGCSSNSNNNNTTDAGPGITPTASGVFPSQAFVGRQLRVEISGDATSWDSSSTPCRSAAAWTVGTVTAASATDLFADITIAQNAPVGMADVTVTAGGETFTLSKAFEIDVPGITGTAGVFAQGGFGGVLDPVVGRRQPVRHHDRPR